MTLIHPSPPVLPVSAAAPLAVNREGRELELRPEQVVRASVVEGGQEKVLLDMGQQRILAESRVPLRTGQTLNLQVLQTAPQLQLRLLDTPLNERIGHALHLLSGKFDVLSLLTQLSPGRPPQTPRAQGSAGPAMAIPLQSGAPATPSLPAPATPTPTLVATPAPPGMAAAASSGAMVATGPPATAGPASTGQPAPPGSTPPATGQVPAPYRAALPEPGRQPEPPLAPLAGQLSQSSRETLQAFKSVLSDPALVFDGAQLRQVLKHLGLHMEARLAAGQGAEAAETLKSALLDARSLLETGGVKSTQVEHLLQNLELHQLFNLRLAQEGAMLWPLPLAFLEQGYLVVEERSQQRGGDQDPPWQLALHLSLKALGDLRIEFLHEPQGLFLRFVCDSQEKTAFFAGFADELRQQITSVPLAGLSFSQGAESPDKTLIRRVLGEGEGVLDARI